MRLIAMLILSVLLAGTVVGEARMPVVGSFVEVYQSKGVLESVTRGVVEDINLSYGLMTLKEYYVSYRFGQGNWTISDKDSCEDLGCHITIGLGTVGQMYIWPTRP